MFEMGKGLAGSHLPPRTLLEKHPHPSFNRCVRVISSSVTQQLQAIRVMLLDVITATR